MRLCGFLRIACPCLCIFDVDANEDSIPGNPSKDDGKCLRKHRAFNKKDNFLIIHFRVRPGLWHAGDLSSAPLSFCPNVVEYAR